MCQNKSGESVHLLEHGLPPQVTETCNAMILRWRGTETEMGIGIHCDGLREADITSKWRTVLLFILIWAGLYFTFFFFFFLPILTYTDFPRNSITLSIKRRWCLAPLGTWQVAYHFKITRQSFLSMWVTKRTCGQSAFVVAKFTVVLASIWISNCFLFYSACT